MTSTPQWKSGRPPKAGVYETRVLNLPDQIYYARWWQDQWLSDRATPDEAAQQIHPSMMTEREWRGEPMQVKAVPSEKTDNALAPGERKPGEIAGPLNDTEPLERVARQRDRASQEQAQPAEGTSFSSDKHCLQCSATSESQCAIKADPVGNYCIYVERLERELAESVEDSKAILLENAKLNEALSAMGDRDAAIHAHDCPVFHEFYSKHAVGSKLPPSCLVCGHAQPDREEWAIQHMELPNIIVCRACRDKAQYVEKKT